MNIESFNSDTHLTYEELVEYSRGNLSNSEMHRLEQHLIGCELCNEALEGVSTLGYADAGSSIERIRKETGAEATSGLGTYHYLGIAASVLLIAVLGFVFTRSGDEPELLAEETSEAKTERMAEADQTPAQQYAEVDSVIELSADTTRMILADNTQETIEPITVPPQISEQETDSNLLAVEPAATEEGVGQGVVVADLEMTALDTASKKESAMDSSVMALNEIADQEDQEIAAKSRMAAPSQPTAAEDEQAASNELAGEYIAAEPERGMRAYQRYLRRNLVYPEAAKENSITGDVVLQVTINTDGSLGEIIVETSLGYGCDQEAIRLIREGRTWQAATRGGSPITDRVTITVSFER